MIKECLDPIFIGYSLYATVKNKTLKLTQIKSAKASEGGRVTFETKNSTYLAEFTGPKYRADFIADCKAMGVWDE